MSPKRRMLKGCSKSGYSVRDLGGKYVEAKTVETILELCEQSDVNILSVEYSGLYYILREDGWYITSDSDVCDKIHNLKPEGNFVCKKFLS